MKIKVKAKGKMIANSEVVANSEKGIGNRVTMPYALIPICYCPSLAIPNDAEPKVLYTPFFY